MRGGEGDRFVAASGVAMHVSAIIIIKVVRRLFGRHDAWRSKQRATLAFADTQGDGKGEGVGEGKGVGECRDEGEPLLLLVRCEDTGCGIPEDEKELVLHAFARVSQGNEMKWHELLA